MINMWKLGISVQQGINISSKFNYVKNILLFHYRDYFYLFCLR